MYQSSIDAADYEPFVHDGTKAGSVHWLDGGDETTLVSGIWRALPGDVPDGFAYDFPMNETIHVLQGLVDIELADGRTISLGVGDIASFAQGTNSTWRVDPSGVFRKFFVCHAATADDHDASADAERAIAHS